MRSARSCDTVPSDALARAAAFFSRPSARMTRRGHTKRGAPIEKKWRDRSVCAPHRRSAGTSTGPIASCSVLVGSMVPMFHCSMDMELWNAGTLEPGGSEAWRQSKLPDPTFPAAIERPHVIEFDNREPEHVGTQRHAGAAGPVAVAAGKRRPGIG